MSNSTKRRFDRILAGLAAIALAGGCQLALSSFTKRTGASSGPAVSPVASSTTPEAAPAPEPVTEPAPEPQPEPEPEPYQTRAEPERETRRPSSPATPPPKETVTYHHNERVRPDTIPRCSVSGRGEICDSVCTDVQISDTNCGACGIRCNAGNHCDFSTCRDPEGKPQ